MYPFKTLVVSREGSGIWIILGSSDFTLVKGIGVMDWQDKLRKEKEEAKERQIEKNRELSIKHAALAEF